MPLPPGRGPLRTAGNDWIKVDLIAPLKAWWQKQLDGIANSVFVQRAFVISQLDSEQNIPRGPIERYFGTAVTDPILKVIWSLLGLVELGLVGLGAAVEPYKIGFERETRRIFPYTRPSVGEMIRIKDRIPDLAPLMDKWITEEGYDQTGKQILETLDRNLLSVRDYFEGYARGDLTDSELTAKLQQLSYNPDEIHTLYANYPNLLTPSQAIEQAQRGTASGGAAGQYDLDKGITPEFLAAMTKQHYDEQTSTQLWRLSRQLPSLSQAFEMKNRLRPDKATLPFSDGDLDYILQAAGIPEYFADRLKAIAEPAYPRLIISGMYRAGSMTADEVLDAVKDLGYTGERAEKVAAYLTRDAKSDKQNLSRDAIIQAYKRGLYSHEQANTALVSIGLSQDEADFFLNLADYDLDAQMTDAQLQVIQARYVNGITDETGLAVELGKLNLPSERTNVLQDLWSIQRNNKINTPSRGELDDFLRRGIITHDIYRTLLKRDGFEQTSIEYFVLRIDQIIADDAAAELSAQQTEQQRLSTATLRTTYQVDKANISVQIAQLKSAIADIQLAQHSLTDPLQIGALSAQIADYKNQIVHLNEQAANLYSTFVQANKPPQV